jgi:hypothetical protein
MLVGAATFFISINEEVSASKKNVLAAQNNLKSKLTSLISEADLTKIQSST